jgi:DnaJ-domain-containing protein 1
MPDYFALLQEPRRPWLDAGLLKSKFFALSADMHPDRVHNASQHEKQLAHERYAEINAAYNCLRNPKDRLLHVLELELGGKPSEIERIPAGTMEIFMETSQVCRAADQFLAEKAKVTSPLLKVQLFEQAMEWTARLNTLQQSINIEREQLFEELKGMNAHWEAASALESPARQMALPLGRLEEIYRAVSYISRWTGQIQERVAQLSF